MSSEMKHVMDPLIHHRTCRFVTRAWKLPAGGDMTGAEDECCLKRQKVNKESDRLLSSLDGDCLEDRVISPEPHKVVLVHLFESVIRRYVTLSALWLLPPPGLLCTFMISAITWTSLSPHLDLLQSPSFVPPSVCPFHPSLVLYFCFWGSVVYMITCSPVCLSSWTSWWSSASLKSSHSFLLSAFRSCSVCRVRESDTSQRISSLHTVHPEGNMTERLSRSVDQWQLPHFNNGK